MVARITILVISILVTLSLPAQDQLCGTIASERDIVELSKLDLNLGRKRMASEDGQPTFIAITAHIVRRDDGTGGLSVGALESALENVNEIYASTNLEFFLFGEINYIDDDTYFDFDSSQESDLTLANNVENTINVYFFNSASSGGNGVCGYAYFPSSGRDHIIMANNCTTNGSTFPHELGHYFSLYHTHGKTNAGTTDELVDGSNCSNAGDDVCDTPADPNLSGKVDSNCVYTGTAADGNGDTFVPDPRNLMSYSVQSCRIWFSDGQEARIVSAYQEYKTYLIDKYYTANFSALENRVCVGSSVAFTDKSVEATTYEWSFPGGSPATSSDPNPTVSYSSVGTYDVSLTITTEHGDTETKTISNYVNIISDESDITTSSGSFEESELNEEVLNADEDYSFESTSLAASDGTQSVYINCFSYSSEGQEDYLVLGTFDTSVEKFYHIAFDYAYARYDDQYNDGLAFSYKDPCGEWIDAWFKSNSDLATTSDHTTSFVPENDEWETVDLYLQIPDEFDAVEFAFKSINGYGNNIYVDNYHVEVEPFPFSVGSIDVTNATCFTDSDGSLVINPSESTGITFSLDGENYQSSNTFSGLSPGQYDVYLKNQDDFVLKTNTTVGPEEIEIELQIINPTCSYDPNGVVEVIVAGGTGNLLIDFDGNGQSSTVTYENLFEGNYSVTVTDENGCTATSNALLNSAFASPETPLITVVGNSLSITSGADIIGIEWYLDDQIIESNSGKTSLANPGSGSYTVEVMNEQCSAVSDPFVVLSEDEIKLALELYPNPAATHINVDLPISLKSEITSVRIRDLTGRLYDSFGLQDSYNLSSYQSGLYLIEFAGEDFVVSKRFMKR